MPDPVLTTLDRNCAQHHVRSEHLHLLAVDLGTPTRIPGLREHHVSGARARLPKHPLFSLAGNDFHLSALALAAPLGRLGCCKASARDLVPLEQHDSTRIY